MDPADEIRIREVKKALEPYLRRQRANEVVITPEKWSRPQRSAEPLYPSIKPATPVVPKGESLGRAWNVVAQRLPDEWHITRLGLDKTAWHASAAPATQWAWSIATKQGLPRSRKYVQGEGISAIEALLDLAVQLESWPETYLANLQAQDRRDAVDDLFESLFD